MKLNKSPVPEHSHQNDPFKGVQNNIQQHKGVFSYFSKSSSSRITLSFSCEGTCLLALSTTWTPLLCVCLSVSSWFFSGSFSWRFRATTTCSRPSMLRPHQCPPLFTEWKAGECKISQDQSLKIFICHVVTGCAVKF